MNRVPLIGRRRSCSAAVYVLLAWATLVHSAFCGEIEFVDWNAPLPLPDASFRNAEDGTGVLLTLTPKQDAQEDITVHVTAESGHGDPLRVIQQSPTSYRIESPEKSFFFLRIVGDDSKAPLASSPRNSSSITAVYSGDLNEALQRLRMRVDRLPPAIEGDDLLAVQQRDMREWLIHRIDSIKVDPEAAASQVTTGSIASEMLYADELLTLLEGDGNSAGVARERQLPARQTFHVKDGSEIRQIGFDFLLRLPKSEIKEPWPMLVIVHGSTPNPSIESGRRVELDEVASQMDFPFMTVAPIVNREMRRGGWNPEELAAFVESLIAQYPVDRDRVYLSGFSAGGFATVATVARRPDLFAAYAPLCGSGDPAWAPILAPVPAYLYHGDADATVSCYGSVRFYQALKAAGGQPSMRVYRGLGHPVWGETYRELDFYRRLLAHRRVPLVGTPFPTPAESGEGNRFELYEAEPVATSQICWIDQPLTLADLWGRENSLRQLQQKLERLYPSVPLTGNVILSCPDGWNDAASPVSIGIAVEGQPTVPDGFVLRPLQGTSRLAAIYRGEFLIDELAEAASRFQRIQTTEGDSSQNGLVVELVGSGRRGGGNARVVLRASIR